MHTLLVAHVGLLIFTNYLIEVDYVTWLYSLVAFWGWDKTLGPIGPGFDSYKGVFPYLLGFLLNWCIDIMSNGDGYDRVVLLVAR
ncbi:hypothetical protein Hanom_Chr02g00150331 [Helianthus anomalus]